MNRQTISSSWTIWLCGGFVFVAALLLYSWTLAPTVTLVDSGELIVVAHGLGVAHPPGFPLWVLLAHFASVVPFGSVAMRVNFSSALFAALASGVLALVVAEMMIIASYLASAKRTRKSARRRKTAQDSLTTGLPVFAPAVGAGLLMAFSRTLWFYATITEVYALNTLLILVIFFLMLRWRRCIVADRERTGAATNARQVASAITAHDPFLYAAALVFGLALGDHHVTVGLTLPAIAVIVYRTEGMRLFLSRRLLYAALISIAGLIAVYSYLPLAASGSPAIDWGTPNSLQKIWWHITGRQYQVFLSFRPSRMGEQSVQFVTLMLREFSPWWLPLPLVLGCAGFVRAFKTDRSAFWFLLVIILASLAYNLSYEIAEDKDAYYLPTFVAVAIASGFGIRWLIQIAVADFAVALKRYLTTTMVVLVAPAIAFIGNWPFNNHKHYFLAHDYIENIFSSIAPNGLLLTQDWQVASPAFYLQQIEQRRPDVRIVDVNLLRRPWYFDCLRRAYPDLIARSREKVDAFVQELKEWERDPAAYARDRELTLRINTAFLEMIQAMVRSEMRLAPVYITNDLISRETQNGDVTNWLTKAYQLVPEGLVFDLVTDRDFHDPPDWHLQTRGLADGTLRFEKDDVINVKVLPSYTSMLVNRGRYLVFFKRYERAMAAFREALALSPGLDAAQQGLEECAAKLRQEH
jgi:tetratricopeptide (TPR) repeat protein